MPDITTLTAPSSSSPSTSPGSLKEGYISQAPASFTDPVYVVIPEYSRDHNFGPCQWMPRGSTLPQQGDKCWVGFIGDQQRPVVVGWDGDTTFASGGPIGPAGGDLAGTYPNPTVAKATNGLTVGTAGGSAKGVTLPTGDGTTPGAAKARLFSVVNDWIALGLNAAFTPSGWVLDDTSRGGWFYKLDIRAGQDVFALYRVPAGAGAHVDEFPALTVSPTGVLSVPGAVQVGGIAAVLTNDARLADARTPTGVAGGDLTGTYPSPTIGTGAVTDTKVAAANKDGAVGTASMRTLGTGAQQAAAGNHTHSGLTADQAAGTASVRTLGTGALQAAAGNHTHAGLTADQAAGVASIRTLGTGATQAAAGNDSRITGAIQSTEKGAANGVASLGADGKVPTAQLPAAGATPALVTALPGSPSDGLEVYFQSSTMATLGVAWHLRYRSASASIYKWEFLGGGPLHNVVDTTETSTSTAFADMATVGPQVTVPLAGDYIIEVGARIANNTTAAFSLVGFAVGATAAIDNDAALTQQAGAANGLGASGMTVRRKDGIAASSAIVAKYRITAGIGTYSIRFIRVTPIRLG